MEQKLKEAELRWEEADAMVRALERRLRESGSTTGDAQAEAVLLQGQLEDFQATNTEREPLNYHIWTYNPRFYSLPGAAPSR